MALLMDYPMHHQLDPMASGKECYLDGYPQPSVEQARVFIRLSQEISHYVQENEFWTECIATLLQMTGRRDGFFGKDDGLREFNQEERNNIQSLLLGLFQDTRVQKPMSAQGSSNSARSSHDPTTLEDTLFDSVSGDQFLGQQDAILSSLVQAAAQDQQVRQGLSHDPHDPQWFSQSTHELMSQRRSDYAASSQCALPLPPGPVLKGEKTHLPGQGSIGAMLSSLDPPTSNDISMISELAHSVLQGHTSVASISRDGSNSTTSGESVESVDLNQTTLGQEDAIPSSLIQVAMTDQQVRQGLSHDSQRFSGTAQELTSQRRSQSSVSSDERARPLPPGPVVRQQTTPSESPPRSESSLSNTDGASHAMQLVATPSTSNATSTCTFDSECTLVVQGVPARYVQADLLRLWDPRECKFNFLFLPYSRKQKRYVTYCFINFKSVDAALCFQSQWVNKMLPQISPAPDPVHHKADHKVIPLHFNLAQVQGFAKNIRHVANDPKFNALKFPPEIFDDLGNAMNFRETLQGVLQS